MALVCLEALQLAGASIMARRADADIVDGRQAAAVSEAQSAGAAEVHRIPLIDSITRAAIHAGRDGTRVTKLAPASYISIPAPEKTQMEKSATFFHGH